MTTESEFKKKFISKLNQKIGGWIDGDKEVRDGKKVDILNHSLSVAIEIKDDTKYKIIADGIARTGDLKLMNQRLSDHVKSANNKFKLYPNYKTILLLRTEYIPDIIKYAIEGLDQFKKVNDQLVYNGKVGKYSKFGKEEVGGFLIISHKVNYFTNYLAKPIRVCSFDEVTSFVNLDVKPLQ